MELFRWSIFGEIQANAIIPNNKYPFVRIFSNAFIMRAQGERDREFVSIL